MNGIDPAANGAPPEISLGVVLVYVLAAVGLLHIIKWLLMEVGDFWRWFKEWSRTL